MAALIGVSLGMASAFFGGWAERIISRATDVMMSFDPLLLGVLIVALLGPGVQNLSIAIAAALVPPFIRLSRASTLSVRQEDYVNASIAMGRSSAGTIGLHILPNISGPLVVMLTIWIGSAIRLEASLSFIGLGAQAPAPSWGNMVREGVSDLFSSPLPAVFAGLAITLTVLACNVLGDALRDRLDPDRVTAR
jgi:ABC-type dipeptide/oligopeptide/nickel transport system permease subunit